MSTQSRAHFPKSGVEVLEKWFGAHWEKPDPPLTKKAGVGSAGCFERRTGFQLVC